MELNTTKNGSALEVKFEKETTSIFFDTLQVYNEYVRMSQ